MWALFFRERKTHKHKQICRIVPGLGGCRKFVYVFVFFSFLMVEKKHINKIPPKIPGQSRENIVYVFCCLCVFFAPYFPIDRGSEFSRLQRGQSNKALGNFLLPTVGAFLLAVHFNMITYIPSLSKQSFYVITTHTHPLHYITYYQINLEWMNYPLTQIYYLRKIILKFLFHKKLQEFHA